MLNQPYVLLILATLFWGGNFALGRAVSGDIPPISLSYLRWIEAAIFFLPFCWREIWQEREALKKNWLVFLSLGATGIVGFNICVYLAVQYTTAINASLLNSFSPIVITLMSIFFLKESVNLRQALGIMISFLGVVWIIVRGQLGELFNLAFNQGDLIMLIAVLLWGVYNMVLKKRGKVVPQRALFFASILGGLAVSWPLVIYENYRLGLGWVWELTSFHYLSLLYFGIFPTILSFLFFNKAMLLVGPSRAAIFANFIVLFAAIFGILFLGERLLASHLVGGILIILGVYLNSWQGLASTEKNCKGVNIYSRQ